MWKPIYQPEPWQQFVKRKDIKGLPLMEQRKKYMQEQLLFESYLSTLNTVNTVSTAAAGAAGGPAPSTGGGGGGGGDYDIEFKVNTAYNISQGYYDVPNPTTRLNLNFSTTATEFYFTGTPFVNGNVWNGDVTIDWGDGTVETKTGYDVGGTDTSNVQSNWYGKIGLVQHDYATDGEYTVKIKGPGAYYLRFMWTPLVELIKYDPALTEHFGCLFSYMPRAATQNFVGDISNWVIPAGKSLAHLAGHDGITYNINTYANRATFGCELDFSNWDISGTTSLAFAFTACNGFQASQIANWVVPSTCFSLEYAFYGLGLSSQFQDSAPDADISTLDVSNWDTSGVADWARGFENSNYGGIGVNSLSFANLANSTSLITKIVSLFARHVGNTLWSTTLSNWNYGGDTSAHGIYFPGNPGFADYLASLQNIFENKLPLSKTNFGDTLIGWANNSDLTINSTLDVSGLTNSGGLTDFDYSGDPAVVAALTTLQNTKGWTLTGFTF